MSIKDKKKKKIMIACGGTAGHIFPGLALADELLKRHNDLLEISFITSDNTLSRRILKGSGYEFHALGVKGLKKRSIYGNIDFLAALLRETIKSAGIVAKKRPDCFVGFGSYVSGPPFLIASLLNIPTVIHEQNVKMGKANRLMRRFAKKVALSFPPESDKTHKTVVTGNPMRREAMMKSDRSKSLESLALDTDKFTILVIGGSQGSQALNSVMLDALNKMDESSLKKIQMIHVTGSEDYEATRLKYENLKVSHRVYPFFEDMGLLYCAADMALSRAGASVLFELCYHNMPSIIVPYPFAGGHQVDNARYFAEKNAAIMIEEKDCSSDLLIKNIIGFLENKKLCQSLRENMASITAGDAAKRLADEVIALAGLQNTV